MYYGRLWKQQNRERAEGATSGSPENKKAGIKRMLRIILILEILCLLELLAVMTNNSVVDGLFGNLSKRENIIEMCGISQSGIPTGCESVSTVMVLQHLGIEITPQMFIDNYLPRQKFYRVGDTLFGPDPQDFFAGNPYEKNSLGCFPPVIIKALDNMKRCGYSGMEDLVYADISGIELSQIVSDYIAQDIPVLVWVTMEMKESYEGMQYYLEDGSLYTWRAMEHCMVLCGYDEEFYYLMDPLADGERVAYEKWLVEARYEEVGRGAIVLTRNTL